MIVALNVFIVCLLLSALAWAWDGVVLASLPTGKPRADQRARRVQGRQAGLGPATKRDRPICNDPKRI
jgi:hypothetical protein